MAPVRSHITSHISLFTLLTPSCLPLLVALISLAREIALRSPGLTSESPWMISSNNNSRKKNDNDDVRDPITFTLGKKLNSATLACRGGVLESVCWVWLVVARSISLQPQT